MHEIDNNITLYITTLIYYSATLLATTGFKYKLSTLLKSCWQFEIANPKPYPVPKNIGHVRPVKRKKMQKYLLLHSMKLHI